MILKLIALNSLGWIIVHLFIAAIFVRLPSRLFSSTSHLDRVYPQEINLYRKLLRIKSWKRHLPDGSSWVGSAARAPVTRKPACLHQLILESRRGEAAHWLMFAACPLFFLWNPPKVWPILILYAIAANLPCIAAQRFNRHTARRILGRTPGQSPTP